MSLPTPFVQNYGYASDRNLSGSTGNHLDSEFTEIATVTNAICNSIALLLRDDGALRNQTVHANAFTSDGLALIAGQQNGNAERWTPLGFWATATVYEPTDIVETGSPGVAYVCTTEHVSGTFAVDHAAGKWIVLSSPRSLTSGDVTSALGFTPVNVAGDTMTGPLSLANGSSLLGMTLDDALVSTNALVTADTGWYVNFVAHLNDTQAGFKSDIIRTFLTNDTEGAEFNAYCAGLIASHTSGVVARAIGFGLNLADLTGAKVELANYSSTSSHDKIGLDIGFKNRQNDSDVAPGTYDYTFPNAGNFASVGGLGLDYYNRASKAIRIKSQQATATGEKCGWGRGIVFDEYALDKSITALGTENSIGIDFSELHYYGGTNPENAFHMEGVIAMRDTQQIWWNKTPFIANPNKVKTYFNIWNGRWVLTLNNIERFGVDVNTGDFYQNGSIFGGGGSGLLASNNTWTGTNSFNNTFTIAGATPRIHGDMTTATAVDRLSAQTSVAGDHTEFQILPGAGGGTSSGISVFTDPLVATGAFGGIQIADGVEMVIYSSRLGGSAYLPMVFNVSGTDHMTLNTSGQLSIGTASAPVTGGKLRVNGIVEIDNPVGFSVHRNGTNFNVVANAITAIDWTTEAYDTNSNFDLGADRFTPPAGLYHFSATVTSLGAVDGGQVVCLLYKNGAAFKNGSRPSTSNVGCGSALSCEDQANGTDYYDLRVYQDNPTSTTLSFAGDPVQTFFSGYRVG